MRKLIVAANWKMNGTRTQVADLLEGFQQGIQADGKEVIVFAPFIFLPQVEQALDKTGIRWGGQNAHTADSGAFTGETSLPMLKEFGATHVLAGHSERRTLFGDTDEVVAEKVASALEAGLVPMLCIGETLSERETGTTRAVCERQLQAVLDRVGVEGFRNLVIAYEPVWAIGTGKTATPEQAQETHAAVRAFLRRTDGDMAEHMALLYGGSVKAANAGELFAMPDIDGGLVGGASLKVDEFVGICNAANA